MKTQAVNSRDLKQSVAQINAIKIGLIGILSFLFPQTQILGGMSPFAAALTACLPLRYAAVSVIGSLLGYFVSGLDENHLIYLIIFGVIIVLKAIFRHTEWIQQTIFPSVLVLFSFLTVNIISYFVFNLSGTDLALRICESLIAAGITFFFTMSTNAALSYHSITQFSPLELASTGILIMVSVISLCGFHLYSFNLGVIFGVLCLYVTIYQSGVIGAAMGSIMLSIALNLYSLDFIYLSAVLIVASFLAGLFHMMGKIGQVAVLLSVSIFCAFLIGFNLDMLFYLMCIVIASGLFLSIPQRILKKLTIAGERNQITHDMKDHIENRLGFAAETIRDLQNSLEQVSNKFSSYQNEDITSVYNKTAGRSCQSCGLRLSCWDDRYNDTVDAFHKMTQMLQKNGTLTADDVKSIPQMKCCRPELLANRFLQSYQEYTANIIANRRITEVRNLAVEQLSGISQMLWEVSEEISEIKQEDTQASKIVTDVFTEHAVPPQCVFCSVNPFGRLEIEIDTLTGVEFDSKQLCRDLSKALKRDFALPSISKIKNKVRICFYETANFQTEFGICQITKKQDDICGDSYEYFIDNKGNAYVILSDGMGSGRKAAIDSTMTCGIILKLIKAGFGLDSVIKFVNSSLQIKSSDESLSTIDIAKLDLYTGQVDFYKAGSACSFLNLDGTVAKVETHSLPVGILQGIEFDKKSFILHEKDMIILLSDGVLELGEPVIAAMIQQNAELSCQELAAKICKTASEQLSSHDDLTVLTLKLQKGV